MREESNCVHVFQEVSKGRQFCLDCKKILWNLKKEQKSANQPKKWIKNNKSK